MLLTRLNRHQLFKKEIQRKYTIKFSGKCWSVQSWLVRKWGVSTPKIRNEFPSYSLLVRLFLEIVGSVYNLNQLLGCLDASIGVAMRAWFMAVKGASFVDCILIMAYISLWIAFWWLHWCMPWFFLWSHLPALFWPLGYPSTGKAGTSFSSEITWTFLAQKRHNVFGFQVHLLSLFKIYFQHI
jgi:hypothetical protein